MIATVCCWTVKTDAAISSGNSGGPLLDLNGRVCEAPGFNVFVVQDGRLRTPGHDILEGVTRAAVMDLASARDIKLVPVDDKTMNELKKANPGYNKLVIKAGTYPKQDKDVPVIGYSTHIIAACDLPEDAVYKMTKAMAENVDAMAAVVREARRMAPLCIPGV